MTRFRRVAYSLDVLLAEVNARWPNRSKVSDGAMGDPAHAARKSDHNPNTLGIVRARDITANGIDAPWLAEHIRLLGKSGHPPLQNHGYVIWNRRAAYATNGWKWVRYTGSNPHDHHIHTSVGQDPAQYDNKTPWGILTPTAPPKPPAPKPPAIPKEMDVTKIVKVKETNTLWAMNAVSRRAVEQAPARLLVARGFAIYDKNGQPFVESKAIVELVPVVS